MPLTIDIVITVCISVRRQKTYTDCIIQPRSPAKTERDFLKKETPFLPPRLYFWLEMTPFERVFHVSRLDKRRFELEVAEVT